MPGLDDSDHIAMLRVVIDDTAAQVLQYVQAARSRILEHEADISAQREGNRATRRLLLARSIAKQEDLITRLESADPWAFWPVQPDEALSRCAAWAGAGYWQGFFPDPASRFPLIKRQYAGSPITETVLEFGFQILRERLAILALAQWWHQAPRPPLCGLGERSDLEPGPAGTRPPCC